MRHRSVEDLVALLETFLDEVTHIDALGPVGNPPVEEVEGPTAPLTRQPRRREPGESLPLLTLTADPATNRIIAMGEPRLLDQVGELIKTLDVRHPQVLVETLVVTLNDAQTLDLGVELQRIGVSGDVQVQLSSLFGLGSPDPTSAVLPEATGTGFGAVALDPGSYSGVLRALEVLNKGRTQSVPKVLVNNGQEASLQSVLQSPYLTTNASNTVATTSFGGTQDAGTQVTVRPQIAEGDQLVLDYSVSISTFVGDSADPELPPPRQENMLQSVVTVPDGYTVVIGGLEIETDTDARSQVPILGSIPVLGVLFQSRSRGKEKSRFFVFLRCSVLRGNGFAELKHLSRDARREASIPDDWPQLEPRLIR